MSVRKQDRQNHRTAEYGCEWVDLLLADTSSAVVDQLQEALWAYVADTERELQKLGRRDKRRREWWARTPRLGREAAERRRLHLEQMGRRRAVLEERRQILRCIGDACAWIVLRADPSTIHPLYARDRTHFLAVDDLGVIGPRSVMQQAHASGDFLVLNTDLTRCLGVGDLVVVPADGGWLRPLVFEVKTRMEGEDHFATWLIGARPVLPQEVETLARFSGATGFEVHDPFSLRDREKRQTDEIQEGTRRILRHWMRIENVLDTSCEDHWAKVESVLSGARRAGAACEIAEDGVAYAAIRNAPGDDAAALMDRMLREVRNAGVRIPDYHTFTSVQLRSEDALSAMVLPFLLWKLPPEHRAALLNSELEFFSFVSKDVWRKSFERHGLEWLKEHDWWRLSRAGRHMTFDPIRVARIRSDAAAAAFSPDAFARAIARALDRREE